MKGRCKLDKLKSYKTKRMQEVFKGKNQNLAFCIPEKHYIYQYNMWDNNGQKDFISVCLQKVDIFKKEKQEEIQT